MSELTVGFHDDGTVELAGLPSWVVQALGELPELAVGGAWSCINEIMARGSAALGTVALEMDICGLGVAQLQAIGSAADWVVSKQLQLPIQTDCLAELEYSTRGHIMM